MKLWVVGMDFRTSALETRTKAHSRDPNFVVRMTSQWSERLWLQTCNRLEIYGFGEEDGKNVVNRWIDEKGLQSEMAQAFYVYQDVDALRHLFRVASSLESMVLGENQIISQVKRAYEAAHQSSHLGPVLHRCFQDAFRSAKRVRTETEVGQLSVSIPSLGVKMAERILGDLKHRNVLILGLGEIGRVAAEHFASVQPKSLLLFNRTRATADELAEKLSKEGSAVSVVDSFHSHLVDSDVIVSAVDQMILFRRDLEAIHRRNDLQFLLDLSVPPSVEKFETESLFRCTIDDLKTLAEENQSLRKIEKELAESMIDEEVEKCIHRLNRLGKVQFDEGALRKKDPVGEWGVT